MNAHQQLRELLGPADPAGSVEVPLPVSAEHLIRRAESERHLAYAPASARRRRLRARVAVSVLVPAVVVATAAVVTLRPAEDRSAPPAQRAETANIGVVLEPIAYQIRDQAPAAGPELRKLARAIGAADYDGRLGSYAYHHLRSWGSTRALGPGDRDMSLAQETWTWSDANGRGVQRTRQLQPEFPDEASRRYWQGILGRDGAGPATSAPTVTSTGAVGPARPVDLDDLASVLRVEAGASAAVKAVNDVYRSHVVPFETRRKIIETIADLPGLRWRGSVTDRAGRAGVAVTAQDEERGVELVLIFHQVTGELLAHESVRLGPPRRVLAYNLFLEYGYRSSID